MTKQGWLSVLKGLGIGLAVIAFLMLLLNGIVLKGKDPVRWLDWTAHAIRLAGGFGAAFSAVKFSGDRALITGAVTGIIFGLLWMFIGMLTGSDKFLLMLLMVILFGAFGVLGGYCGMSGKRSRRRRRQSIMKRIS